jgi:oligosaccharide repeat unit polymerase
MNTFWRRIFAPEVIFAASAAAALSPYVLWYWGYKLPVVEHLEITYIPAILWICGLLSFLTGCCLARKKSVKQSVFRLRQKNIPITLLLCVGVMLVVIQVYLAIEDVYGVFPLVDYLSGGGNLEVGTANDQQQYSASGQLGLLTASLFALNSVFLVFIIKRVTRGRGSLTILALAFLTTIVAHLINAKRGGLYATLFYLLVGLSLYFGDPVRALSALVPGRSRILTKSLLLSLAIALVFIFGYLASVRTRGRVEGGTREIISYLQYPLINFEAQTHAAGFGPGDFRILSPFRHLPPYKYAEQDEAFAVTNPRTIRDSPSGIYEYIHWCWGTPGVVGYSMMLGFVTRWLYERSLQSLGCLLSYCYFAVALAMSHTSNNVLILAYVPVPLFIVWMLTMLISTDRATHLMGKRRTGDYELLHPPMLLDKQA